MFCVVKDYEALGLAKIVDLDKLECIVEYFDSPAKTPQKKVVPADHITKKQLGGNTRVYHLNGLTGTWLVGRVQYDDGESLEVRFPGSVDCNLSYDEVFVRWKVPIEDPIEFLANVITETPMYAESRGQFLDSYIAQRRASWGIPALMSSIIELESHQIGVVRRVLNDASQRYLLADEVGLGKTIEAGVIIRQAVLDNPNHQIIVLAPKNLVPQWRQELIQRFSLRNYLDDSIFVLPQHCSLEIESKLECANMLVIDEAHHLASEHDDSLRRLYDLVAKASHKIERLLLLSATPILRNESGFLRMLHLLDPVVYDLNDEEAFRSKILHRQTLAEAVAALDPENVLFLDSVLDNLLAILPDDRQLAKLTRSLQELLVGFPDESDPELHETIRILRAHLSETYRLHRRILRNRRKHVTGLTPERNGAKLIEVNESQVCRLESALEDWRICATTSSVLEGNERSIQELKDFYWNSIEVLLEHPERLKDLCQNRLNFIDSTPHTSISSFEQESELLRNISEVVDSEQWWSCRLDCLLDLIKELLTSTAKVVVFCGGKLVADIVFSKLKDVMRNSINRYKVPDKNDLEMDVNLDLPFLTDPLVKVIVCDRASEEGINLQGGEKIVIHFDLPIEPNRTEQRIGRVDRYGSGSSIKSFVIIDGSSRFQQTWFTLLNEGLCVFDRSISSLQYLADEKLQQLRTSLFVEGVEAMSLLAENLGGFDGEVNKELKLIDQQDGLDELSEITEVETESIVDADCDWRDIRQSMMKWTVDTLLFDYVEESSSLTRGTMDPPFRFQYKKFGSQFAATLIPLSEILEYFLGAIDFDASISNSQRPFSYINTCHRTTAVRRGCQLIRYGNEFVEAVKEFSDVDDRGRSFAMWRQFYKGLSYDGSRMFFRFDFLIEARLDEAKGVLVGSELQQSKFIESSLARRGDSLFPPRAMRVWIDEEGDEPDPEFVEMFLSPCYLKKGNDRYKDKNLNSKWFRSLMSIQPEEFSNWNERCKRMQDRAYAIMNARQELSEQKCAAINKARIEDEVRYAQLTTRIQTLEGNEAAAELAQRNLEARLNSALYKGINDPIIRIDVAGVVLLSNQSLPFLKNINDAKI
jgi:ATP-dependent helicase HepA